MALTEKLILNTYQKLKDKATNFFENGNVQKGLLYTHLAAYTNYSFWLSYYDEEMEQLLRRSGATIKQRACRFDAHNPDRCVMFDSMARFRGGLTVQYVKAIIACGWELLYITDQEMAAPHHVELLNFLRQYKNITVIEVPTSLKGIRRLQYVYDLVVEFNPKRLYLHSNSSNAFFPSICYSLPPQIQKFYIDMADHGFRMGMESCDYVFQFRSLGCSIAVKERRIRENQILYLPFYPIIDNKEYQGLPEECVGKVIILSGGIFWKIIDQEDTFFKLCKLILEHNKQVVIVYPGGGDSSLVEEKLKKYKLSDRFLLLGWRNDISELFRHSDIFLNTYPHGGGTMSLYAAHFGKPILSFEPDYLRSNPIERFICQRDNYRISSVGVNEFVREADRLIESKSYRREKADRVCNCVIQESTFNNLFKEMSLSHKNQIPFCANDDIGETDKLRQKKIDFHNKQGEYQMRLVALSGLNTITLRKEFIWPFILKIGPKLKRVFFDRGFHFNRA